MDDPCIILYKILINTMCPRDSLDSQYGTIDQHTEMYTADIFISARSENVSDVPICNQVGRGKALSLVIAV